MARIVGKKMLSEQVAELRVSAPDIAVKAQPGHFVIVRDGENGERIPLTIADWDTRNGTIDLVIQAVGRSTVELVAKPVGSDIPDFAGPLGRPAPLEKSSLVLCVAGGIGSAPLFPQARALYEGGCRVVTVLGARTASLLTWEDRLRSVSHELWCCTEDGSKGEKGLVTAVVSRLLDDPAFRPGHAVAIGPVPMMRAVSEVTRPFGVPTTVSLNALMVDGTGMCGACRVTVGGELKFTCVDGPDFDGHLVDYDELANRQRAYREQEQRAMKAKEECQCCRG